MILCKNGHPNPDGATYCQVCKVYIDAAIAPVVPEPEPAPPEPPPQPPPAPPAPPAPAAARPNVFLSQSVVTVAPGGAVTCEIRIENPGETPDAYRVELAGPAAALASLAPERLELEPGAGGAADVTFWSDAAASAGNLPFEVRVHSAALPGQPVSARGVLEIASSAQPPPPPPGPGVGAPLGLALAGSALLAIGMFLTQPDDHSFVSNDFGGSVDHGGLYTSLAPAAVVLGALVAALLLRKAATRELGAGLLLGFGIVGTVKYFGVIGAAVADGTAARWIPVLLGGPLLVVAGIWASRSSRRLDRSAAARAVAGVAAAGAALIVLACFVPFSHGGTNLPGDQVLVERGWSSVDPLLTAVAVAILALVLLAVDARALWFGALIAIGIASSLLWLRFVGVPVVRHDRLGIGAFLGLAGSVVVVAAGWLGYRARLEHATPA